MNRIDGSWCAGNECRILRKLGRDGLIERRSSDLDADSVVRAVDELWQRRIVREAGDGYGFAHDMLRESAYAQVSPANLLKSKAVPFIRGNPDEPDVARPPSSSPSTASPSRPDNLWPSCY